MTNSAWLTQSYPDSAKRNYVAATRLDAFADHATAGHLFGVAAECAIKASLQNAGITVDQQSGFRVHLPVLTQRVLQAGRTRHMRPLLTALSASPTPMADYAIDTRYAADLNIDQNRCASWRQHAQAILGSCGLVI